MVILLYFYITRILIAGLLHVREYFTLLYVSVKLKDLLLHCWVTDTEAEGEFECACDPDCHGQLSWVA